MNKRIIFTGGSGKAGRHAITYLRAQGHAILNLDLQPLEMDGVNTLITDLTDSGQVFNALSMHFDFDGFATGQGPAPVDAVVHFAAIPRVLIHPDNETFKANVVSTYNVIEAATKLGIRKIVIASSETTYGVCFADGDQDYHSFPLEEDYDVDPMDSYGLSKVVNEKTARAFAMRTGADIYACASVMSSRRRITRVFRPSWQTRSRASAMPGAISTRATSVRSSIFASPRTALAFRCSTRSMTKSRPMSRPRHSSGNGCPIRRSRGPWASGRHHCPIARSGRSWGSRNGTTGVSPCQGSDTIKAQRLPIRPA